MVMTVSNIRRMLESFEVKGGRTTAAVVGSMDASVEVSLVVEGGGGAIPEDLTLGRLKLSLI